MRFRFLRSVLVLTLVAAAIVAYPTIAWATPEVVRSIVAAAIIAIVNVLIGLVALEWAIDKDHAPFMYAVFGGMGVRMGMILLALTVLLLDGYHALSLALALMGFYIVYTIAEIVYVLQELDKRPSRRPSRRPSADSLSPRTIAVNQYNRR
jgi:hypothetical protein